MKKRKKRKVMVHKHWRTVHELHKNGRPCCGNNLHGYGRRYERMRFKDVKSSWPLCQTRACQMARGE